MNKKILRDKKILKKHGMQKNKSISKKQKWISLIFILIILAILIFLIFFNKNEAKNLKIGNNSSNQEIVDYILNISSYEATIEVEVQSNKNSNKYIIKQQYVSPDTSTQEVLEPENIKGVKIIKNQNQLKLENTKLNLSKVFENYEYMTDNCLDLNTFIEEYKTSKESKYEEKDNQIIMSTQSQQNNKYINDKKLYIDKKTGNPTKMEIKDNSKNTTVYILYNEVKLNSNPQNILAFTRITTTKGV